MTRLRVCTVCGRPVPARSTPLYTAGRNPVTSYLCSAHWAEHVEAHDLSADTKHRVRQILERA